MPLQTMIDRPVTGIQPFNELPIDAEIWREAHNHHHLHRKLHAVSAHRPGIVYGLEVVASQTQGATVIVAPGVAIDSEGNTIVVPQPQPFTLTGPKAVWHIILSYEPAADKQSAVTIGGGTQYFREVESRILIATQQLPKTPFLELARIYRSGQEATVRDAANAADPGYDEIDLLQRRVAFPHCYADAAVGEMAYVPGKPGSTWKPNRAGLISLLREANGRGFHLDFTGPLPLGAPTVQAPTLLYVAGKQGFKPLADAEVEGLRGFLGSGGTLFVEVCAGGDEFSQSIRELMIRLEAQLRPVTKGHPLLASHYVFSTLPAGAVTGGQVLADTGKGIILGTMDYGGAWQGDVEKPEATDSRERIRQAVEFGLNVVAYASRRRRLQELAGL